MLYEPKIFPEVKLRSSCLAVISDYKFHIQQWQKIASC